jgi:hypothetical protein
MPSRSSLNSLWRRLPSRLGFSFVRSFTRSFPVHLLRPALSFFGAAAFLATFSLAAGAGVVPAAAGAAPAGRGVGFPLIFGSASAGAPFAGAGFAAGAAFAAGAGFAAGAAFAEALGGVECVVEVRHVSLSFLWAVAR